MRSPDIQYNISCDYEQLLLNMGFIHDINGVIVWSNQSQLAFSSVLGPGNRIEVSSIDNTDAVKLRTLLILPSSDEVKEETLIFRPMCSTKYF